MSTIEGYVTTTEAAETLGVHVSQVSRYCSDGQLEAVKFGGIWLIKKTSLKKFKPRPVGNPQFQPKSKARR